MQCIMPLQKSVTKMHIFSYFARLESDSLVPKKSDSLAVQVWKVLLLTSSKKYWTCISFSIRDKKKKEKKNPIWRVPQIIVEFIEFRYGWDVCSYSWCIGIIFNYCHYTLIVYILSKIWIIICHVVKD